MGSRSARWMISKCDADKSEGCSLDEIENMLSENFRIIWAIIDTNNDGEINLQDLVGCDVDANGGCTKTELLTWLNTAGVPPSLNSMIGYFFEGIIKA